MPREHNFLLGEGERLTSQEVIHSGGGAKKAPYSLATARQRFSARIASAKHAIAQLPPDACPDGEVVALVTMHPRYIAKTDYPGALLADAGLQAVGSRAKIIKPEHWGTKKHPDEALTEEIFVAGKREQIDSLARQISKWSDTSRAACDLTHVEDFYAPDPASKLRSVPLGGTKTLLEVVLHNPGLPRLVEQFAEYVRKRGGEVIASRRRDVGGLTFVPVRVAADKAEQLASFSFVRVARGMPTMRPVRPGPTRSVPGPAVQLPDLDACDPTLRAVVFDGGIPKKARASLARWVTLHEPAGIGAAHPDFEAHGLGVTTALLFGHLKKGARLSQPPCHVDHVRVLERENGTRTDFEYLDVLDRITGYLDANRGRHVLINLSVGPNIGAQDDEITSWTAELDKRLESGAALTTVAAGNDGELDAAAGLNRIQPPSDGIHVVAVGATSATGPKWERAPYSCVGPGRSPGWVKPEGLAFGGSDGEPFRILDESLRVTGTAGTSFAAPLTLRAGAATRAQLGERITPLAIRALLVNRSLRGRRLPTEVGWGRFETDPAALLTCEDNEALVVYQGTLPVGQFLRARVPLPNTPLSGDVVIRATVCIAPTVDPAHPDAYTRGGLDVHFRPRSDAYGVDKATGRRSHYPKTAPFFAARSMYGAAEYVLRTDGHKWEPCRNARKKWDAGALKEPVFDIRYYHRDAGAASAVTDVVPYALVIGVRSIDTPDLYDRVVRSYAHVLLPLRPRVRIELGT